MASESVSKQILNGNPNIKVSEEKIEQISEFIDMLGIPNNLKGYNYLIEAICYCISDYKYVLNPIKYLYTDIAEAHNNKMENIKTSIERALERAWYLGNADMFESMFGYSIKDRRKSPSLKKFLFLVTKRFTSND